MLLRSIRDRFHARRFRGWAVALVASLAVLGSSLPCACLCLREAGAAAAHERAELAEHAGHDAAEPCPDGECPPASPCHADQVLATAAAATPAAAPAAAAGTPLVVPVPALALAVPAAAAAPSRQHLTPDRSPPLVASSVILRI